MVYRHASAGSDMSAPALGPTTRAPDRVRQAGVGQQPHGQRRAPVRRATTGVPPPAPSSAAALPPGAATSR